MSSFGLVLSALILFFRPVDRIIPIKEAIRLAPRDSVVAESNRVVSVTGIVTLPSGRTDGTLQSFIQDRTGGIRLFEYEYKGPSLLVGDSVTATGRLGIYYGQEEIVSPRIRLLRHRLKVVPIPASVEQIRNGKFHGMLVSFKGKVVRKSFRSNGVSIYLVNRNNDTASVFADFRQDPQFDAAKIHNGSWFAVTGISTRFSYAKPYTGGDDILIGSPADFTPLPESFLDRYSSAVEFVFAAIIALLGFLTVFLYLLRSKVKQKTKELEEQTRVLRLFFDGVAELTGVLSRERILDLALKRGHSFAGTTSVIFVEAPIADGVPVATAFEMAGEKLEMKSQRFTRNAFSEIFNLLADSDALWSKTVNELAPEVSRDDAGDSLHSFFESHLHGSRLTVISANPHGKDFLAIFDHAGPISQRIPRALIKSYILHVYSAYKAAELFDLAKKQGEALESLYNNSVFGLLTISESGTILTANKIALQTFEDEKIIGRKVSEYLADGESGRFNALLTGMASTSKDGFVRFAAEMKRGHGSRNVEFAIQFDPVSRIFYATVQDTSDREYYEDYAAKERKIGTLEKLASSLTHDLNNIVGSITGYSSLLKRKLPRNSKEHHYADIIENSSRKAAELVKEVLGFAQLDAKTLEVVDLSKFISDAAGEFEMAHANKYSIRVTPFGRPLHTRISTSQFKQVILAVLTNAAESMEKGGTIKCVVGLGEVPEPAPAYVNKGEHCFVEIEDRGLGMDETIMRRIFEPFFTTKRVRKYTGLSLSMAYNIVKHHKGFISVRSAPGQGTRVRIFLPRYHEKEKSSGKVKQEAKSLDGNGAKILVVDDEEGVRQLAYDILVDHGYAVITAADGVQALEQLKENPDVRLVVLDMVMPGMGGKDACIEIKKRPKPPKVLICTGYSEISDLDRVLGRDADGLVQKPYSTKELSRAVSNLLAS